MNDTEETQATTTVPQRPAPQARPAATKREEPAKASPTTPNAPAGLIATGRRKESVARVRLVQGSGAIEVNHRPYDHYFPREALRLAIRAPLLLTHQMGKYNVVANVEGGGLTGQAGAIRLGIARALLKIDEAHRAALRGGGLLTRDPREKERKKYGQKGARKRFQWTKR